MEELPPLSRWMDEQVGVGRTFRSLSQWAKKARIPVSSIHKIRDNGSTNAETVVKLARAAGVNPKIVFIRLGWWDEEVEEDDLGLNRVRAALAALPADLRPTALNILLPGLEALRQPEYQQRTRTYLRIADRPEDR